MVALVDMVDAMHAARVIWETVTVTWRSTHIERHKTGKDMGHILHAVARLGDTRSIRNANAFN